MLFLEILALLYVTSAFVTLLLAVCKLSRNVVSEATLKSVSFGVYEETDETKSMSAEKFSVSIS